MPAASPSKSRVANVIAGILAADLRPGAIVVCADGSFEVKIVTVYEKTKPARQSPLKWGQTG